MTKLFEKNIGFQAALLLLALALLWGGALVNPPAMTEGDGAAVLYGLLWRWLSPVPRAAAAVAMALVLLEGIGLNVLLANVGLVSQKSLLPALLYVVAMSAPTQGMTPLVVVNALLIPCLGILMLRGTLLTISRNAVCGATALIGLCTLFYLPAWALLLSYLLIAIGFSLYSWKDWMAMLLGLLMPYVVLLTALYMTGHLADTWQAIAECMSNPGLQVGKASLTALVGNGVLTLALVAGIIALWRRLKERTIAWQKNASTVMLLTVGGCAMMFYSQLFPVDLQGFAIPFSLTVALLLAPADRPRAGRGKQRHAWLPDALLCTLLIAALIC